MVASHKESLQVVLCHGIEGFVSGIALQLPCWLELWQPVNVKIVNSKHHDQR